MNDAKHFNGQPAMASCGIAIMAKASAPGQTKTRLVPPLTFDEAAALNTAFLQDIADNVLRAGCHCVIAGYVAFAPRGSRSLSLNSPLPSPHVRVRKVLARVDHAAGYSSSKALRKKAITSSTARRVGWSGASIRSPVKTECGAFMPAGLAALSGSSVAANAAPKAVRRVWKREPGR